MLISLDIFKKREPGELVSLDFASTSLKVVRLKSTKDGYLVVGADILPAVKIEGDENFRPRSLELPKELLANYAAAAVSSTHAAAKLLSVQHHQGQTGSDAQVREQFGAEDDFRLESVAIDEGKGRSSNQKMLAAALSEHAIKNLLAITASGPPALRSCEVSALAALTTFNHLYRNANDVASCFIEIGAKTTYIFFVRRSNLILLRKYELGSQVIIDKIINDFHVDQKTALNIMTEGAIDLSSVYREELGFLARQASISRDFVERQESCKVDKVVLSGGMACSSNWIDMLRNDIGVDVETIDPFAGLEIAPGALGNGLDQVKPRFTAAIGAGIGGFSTE